jgi:hypothetical protein
MGLLPYISLGKFKIKSAMKKINWYRVAFFALMVGMIVLESCRMFRRCDCPHF